MSNGLMVRAERTSTYTSLGFRVIRSSSPYTVLFQRPSIVWKCMWISDAQNSLPYTEHRRDQGQALLREPCALDL
eukprot:4398253-Pleurochrysis_carterae.AAC.5